MYTLSENILGKRISSGRLSQLVYLVANTTEIVLFGTEIQHPSSEKKTRYCEDIRRCHACNSIEHPYNLFSAICFSAT